uniref:Uncharacterized protein n=1 Tax=Arundo donax TaxID=35708 RepID=A0A0A9FPH6_ARUDO
MSPVPPSSSTASPRYSFLEVALPSDKAHQFPLALLSP